MTFEYVKSIHNEHRTRTFYRLGNYMICETDYGDENPTVEVSIENGKILFLPRIETIYDFDTEKIIDFKINPSAYGSLSYEDIEIMISSLNNALETVKELKRKYIGKI